MRYISLRFAYLLTYCTIDIKGEHLHLPLTFGMRQCLRMNISLSQFSRRFSLFFSQTCRRLIHGHGMPCVPVQQPRPSITPSLNFANEVSQRHSSAANKSPSAQEIRLQTNGDSSLSRLPNLGSIRHLIYRWSSDVLSLLCIMRFAKSIDAAYTSL